MISKQIAEFIRERMSSEKIRIMLGEAEKRNPSLDGQIKIINDPPKERKY